MVSPARAEFKSVYDRCATNAKKTQKTRRMKLEGKSKSARGIYFNYAGRKFARKIYRCRYLRRAKEK